MQNKVNFIKLCLLLYSQGGIGRFYSTELGTFTTKLGWHNGHRGSSTRLVYETGNYNWKSFSFIRFSELITSRLPPVPEENQNHAITTTLSWGYIGNAISSQDESLQVSCCSSNDSKLRNAKKTQKVYRILVVVGPYKRYVCFLLFIPWFLTINLFLVFDLYRLKRF